jgi:tetratricopeptide (TPR) repeat protein
MSSEQIRLSTWRVTDYGMANKRLKTTKTYFKNLVKHTKWVITRNESVGEAIQGVRKDSKKLAKSVTTGPPTTGGKIARKMTEEARHAYNEHRYESAEELLRSAIVEDPKYALAFTYLGHTLYKQRKIEEAVQYWTKATIIDPESDAAKRAQRKITMASKQHNQVGTWLNEYMNKLKDE